MASVKTDGKVLEIPATYLYMIYWIDTMSR